MERRANDTLATLSVTTIRSVRQTVAGLSGGQRQSVAVAKAVMWNSKVVILDEPTAALGVAQTRQVLDLVKRLGEQGLAVVLISHNLHDIFEVADNITVLRLGQNVGEYKRTDVTQTQVVEAITAGKLSKVPGRRRRGDRMSTTAPAPVEGGPGAPAAAAVGPQSLGEYARGWWIGVKSGELGSLPIVVGLIIIAIVFQTQNSNFLTAGNFVNLIVQAAAFATIGMGIVFVLLLGEIDLSVGFVSGVAGVLVALLTFPDNHNVFAAGPALVLALARRRRHRPAARRDHHEARRALLRRDAGGPAGLERGRPAAHRRQGHRHHPEQLLHRLRQRLPAVGDRVDPGRRRASCCTGRCCSGSARNASARGSPALRTRSCCCASPGSPIGVLAVAYVCDQDRGIPYVMLVIAGLFIFWTYVLNRTKFGRHIYAVGGNAEAARRAGINVDNIKMACFAICSMMAAVGGIILASRLRSVDTNSGGGSLLLYSIAAPVIGGTSLFGGRGTVKSAVFGAIVIASIDNGLGLLGLGSGEKFVITGGVLLLAVSVDSISRRGRESAGRA